MARANIFATFSRSNVAGPAEFSAWLDGTDRVVHLSSMWDEFAPPAHRRRAVLARPIGWFIADENVRECFRSLFARIRREHRPVRIGTRYDEHATTRAMRLTLVPLSAGAIEITWTLVDGAPARQIPLVQPHLFHDGEFLRMCSWCQNVRIDSRWQRLEAAASTLGLLNHSSLPPITHGICPSCSGSLAAESAAAGSLSVAV